MNESSLGLVALITHARSVPSEAREQFFEATASLVDDPRVILLRTCHRVELYARPDSGPGVPFELPELPDGGSRLENQEAIRHLFAVAAGLDSIVVGEDQILHQLRDCLSGRQRRVVEAADVESRAVERPPVSKVGAGALEPVLDRLFQLALHVGRKSRAWREGTPRSLADVALDRMTADRGNLLATDILVVGAGQMGRLIALAAVRRGAHVVITSRSVERAVALAADVGGVSVPFGQAGPSGIVGVVVALAGRWEITPTSERSLIDSGIPVFDLSSPPAITPALRGILGDRFVSVDDMAGGGEDILRDRIRRRIERLLDEADTEFSEWVGGRFAAPAIQALTDMAEGRRATEVDRLLRRMPHLEEHDRDLVEQMSRRLVAGLLHGPLVMLRNDDSGERERAARELFSI